MSTVLFVAAVVPGASELAEARRQHPADRHGLVTLRGTDAPAAGLDPELRRALAPHADQHGPGVRRELRGADRPTRLRVLLEHDPWVSAQRRTGAVLAPLDEAATRALVDLAPLPGPESSTPYAAARAEVLALVEAGRDDRAAEVAVARQQTIKRPRRRADLLGDVVSAALAAGRASPLVADYVAAELGQADAALADGRPALAAHCFEEACRAAFHRVLHFDQIDSPLARDPAGFTAPFADSAAARAVRGPGAARTSPAPADPGRPTRVLVLNRVNADFLTDVLAHLGDHPRVDLTYLDLATLPEVERLAKRPGTLAAARLGTDPTVAETLETALRPHLDAADVVLVEWCGQTAALLTHLDPGDARVVVRMHSYEAFTAWPQLIDWTRVDDLVFVSAHLRDLTVAAVPGLREPGGPRLHVLTLAMDLERCVRPKPPEARFTLGMIGAHRVVKDPRWALAVLRLLRARDERYRLVLVRGHLEETRSAATEAYGAALRADLAELGDAVTVTGHTDDVPGALEDIGVILSASARESFHIGFVEGVASGAVPVLRDWPFFPGAARALFDPSWVVDDPAQAADRILAQTSSEEEWRRSGAAASAQVREEWDWSAVRSDYDRLLLDGDAPPSRRLPDTRSSTSS